MNPLGLGFRLTPEELASVGADAGALPAAIRPYAIGRDLVQRPVQKYVIDFFGRTEAEARAEHPAAFQHLLTHVKPERDQNRRETRRVNWWLFGESAPRLRKGLRDIETFVGTCRTAKHRLFTMLPASLIPDAKIVGIALDGYGHLGVLSSRVHTTWAAATGGWLGVGNDSNYNHSDCFGKFPFPALEGALATDIHSLGKSVDEHRKRQQSLHPKLTLTNAYNVLEKLRAGEPFTDKEKLTHEQGLVSVLKQLHDELDAAVFAAYGWTDLWERHLAGKSIDEPLLERLVALNAERAAEEASGHIRWLRPDFQNPGGSPANTQTSLDLPDQKKAAATPAAKGKKLPWPTTLPAQTAALKDLLAASPTPLTPDQIATRFARSGKRVELIRELCQTLTSLGLATETDEQAFAA